MKFSRIILLIAAIAIGCAPRATAADGTIYFYPVETTFTVDPGEKFDVVFNLDNTVVPSSFQYRIEAPDGISFVMTGIKYSVKYTDRVDSDIYSLSNVIVKNSNTLLCTAYNLPAYNYDTYDEYKIVPGTGKFVTVQMQADANIEPGTYKVRVYEILFVTLDLTQYWSPEATLTINVNNISTGVNDITADTAGDEVTYYNLTGTRVDNPSSGVYIRRSGGSVSKVVLP